MSVPILCHHMQEHQLQSLVTKGRQFMPFVGDTSTRQGRALIRHALIDLFNGRNNAVDVWDVAPRALHRNVQGQLDGKVGVAILAMENLDTKSDCMPYSQILAAC